MPEHSRESLRLVCLGGRPDWLREVADIGLLVAPHNYHPYAHLVSLWRLIRRIRTVFGAKCVLWRMLTHVAAAYRSGSILAYFRASNYPWIDKLAQELKVPLLPANVVQTAEFPQIVRSIQPDLLVSVSFGRLIPTEILSIPRLGSVNLHAGRLPEYRGAYTPVWAVLNGEPSIGISTLYMTDKFDEGEVILQTEVPADRQSIMNGSLYSSIDQSSRALLHETIRLIGQGQVSRIAQTMEGACTYRWPRKSDFRIDWTKSFSELDRIVLASRLFTPAYTFHGNVELRILEIADLSESSDTVRPGTILTVLTPNKIIVAVGNRNVVIKAEPADFNICATRYFGSKIKEGDVLS